MHAPWLTRTARRAVSVSKEAFLNTDRAGPRNVRNGHNTGCCGNKLRAPVGKPSLIMSLNESGSAQEKFANASDTVSAVATSSPFCSSYLRLRRRPSLLRLAYPL